MTNGEQSFGQIIAGGFVPVPAWVEIERRKGTDIYEGFGNKDALIKEMERVLGIALSRDEEVYRGWVDAGATESDYFNRTFYTLLSTFIAHHPTGFGYSTPIEVLEIRTFKEGLNSALSLITLESQLASYMDPATEIRTPLPDREFAAERIQNEINRIKDNNSGSFWVDALERMQSEQWLNQPHIKLGHLYTDNTAHLGGEDTFPLTTGGVDSDANWQAIVLEAFNEYGEAGLDFVQANRDGIRTAYEGYRASKETGYTPDFVQWAIGSYLPQEMSVRMDLEGPVNINDVDPTIDPLITNWLRASNLPADLGFIAHAAIKKQVDMGMLSHPALNKLEVFNLLGFDSHRNAITSELNAYFGQHEGGDAFIEALAAQGITTGDLITDVSWAMAPVVPLDPTATAMAPVPFPDAFNDLESFINAVGEWGMATQGITTPIEPAKIEKLNETRFILENFGDLSGFPPVIKNRVVRMIGEALFAAGLDPLTTATAADWSQWLTEQNGSDGLISEAIIDQLNRVEGGDRLLKKLSETGLSIAEAFEAEWNDNVALKIGQTVTQLGTLDIILNDAGMIPEEVEDPDELQAKIDDEAFASKLRPIVEGMPAALQELVISRAATFFQTEQILNPELDSSQILERLDFDETIEGLADAEISTYFGDDELINSAVSTVGGVREFFEIYPELLNVAPDEILRRLETGEVRPQELYYAGALYDWDQFNEVLTERTGEEVLGERAEDVKERRAELDIASEERKLDWLEGPEGSAFLKAIDDDEIDQYVLQLERLGTKNEAARIEFENLKMAVDWMTSEEGEKYIQDRFDTDQQQKLLDLREDQIALPGRETIAAFWESPEGQAILAAETAQDIQDIIDESARRATESEAARQEHENLKRSVDWLNSDEPITLRSRVDEDGEPIDDPITMTGQEFSQERFDADMRSRLIDLQMDIAFQPSEEELATFLQSEAGQALLQSETAEGIASRLRALERRSTELKAEQIDFEKLQQWVKYFSTEEGKKLTSDLLDAQKASQLQQAAQAADQLDFQQLEFELKMLEKPQLEYRLGIGGTRVGQALGLAEEEQAFRGRLESLFMPELQRVAEQQFGRAQAADVLRTLPQDQFQRFFSEIQQEVEREQLTGLKRFDPDVIMHPEGRLLGPEEKIDYYTPEAFVSRVFEQPEVVEKARRAGRLERLRPFKVPVAGRQRRRLLGGRRSFARAGRSIPQNTAI